MSFSSGQSWNNFDCLHESIIKALIQSNFTKPTKIQAEVCQHYKNYYDFLIASQTGSGKTLAFALPIISELIQVAQRNNLQKLPNALIGLIMTPTRQLAQQIEANIRTVLQKTQSTISMTTIIGGMSKQKQMRVVRQQKPNIIIGTPGRIFEFLQDQLFNFQYLKYLVIDQADRMIELGHYIQVDAILQKIFRPKVEQVFEKDFHQINKALQQKQKQSQQNEFYIKTGDGKKKKLNFNLNNISTDKLFEVPAEMFQIFDTTQKISKPLVNPQVMQATKMAKEQKKLQIQMEQQKYQKQQQNQEFNYVKNKKLDKIIPLTEKQIKILDRLKRKIFFVSATLTRQFKGAKYFIKKDRSQENNNDNSKGKGRNNNKGKNNKNNQNQKQKDENNASSDKNKEEFTPKLKALLSRIKFSSKPKIIDQSSLLFLPQGLIQKISFTDGQNQKISLLLCYLAEMAKSSKVIIFANTIKASKRIQFFIESFGYKTVSLHSHMQQKQRLTKLQKFKSSPTFNILISTDVAARGLDFFISNVVQYGVPINGDTYVHRAGRTARANRTGQALIIVDKKQATQWSQINDILAESAKNRKLSKFLPQQAVFNQISQKVQNYEWIRINNQKQKDLRSQKVQQMQADQIGVQIQDQQPRRKYDLDNEQEEMVRHEVKKRVQKIKKIQKKKDESSTKNKGIVWKKNKLVLSPEEIMKLI